MKKFLVIISGSGSNLQALIDQCHNKNNNQCCAVISNVPNVLGLQRAQQAGIATEVVNHKMFDSREAFDQQLSVTIHKYQPDLIVLAGFMRILTPNFVQPYLGKLINIHPSLLPKYPGLHTHRQAISNQDTEQGATVHFVTSELDGGPNIIQGSVALDSNDTEDSLAQKVQVDIEHKIYSIAVNWFLDGRLTYMSGQPQLDGELLAESGFLYEAKTTKSG